MSETRAVNVCIIYPADPLGAIPGGIDTFIRGLLRWAPNDFDVRLIGASTDVSRRPVGKWTRCVFGKSSFLFYPLLELKEPGKQRRIPTSLAFTAALAFCPEPRHADLLVFHGIESTLAFIRDGRPKSTVIHQDMQVLKNAGADIRWRHVPWLYFWLEKILMPRLASVFCVRQNAVENYKLKMPKIADRFFFTPTWVDTETFPAPDGRRRSEGRERLHDEHGISPSDHVLMSVGRLDGQKNPVLLLESFKRARDSCPNLRLLMVGDGQLRGSILKFVSTNDLQDCVFLCGAKTPDVVSQYLHGADSFVLSSAYEGMPMCVLEALGCGTPVVTTDVGEVRRVVRSGVNGEVVTQQDAEDFSRAILNCVANTEKYRGEPCVTAISEFTAEKVLVPIFDNYRHLASNIKSEFN